MLQRRAIKYLGVLFDCFLRLFVIVILLSGCSPKQQHHKNAASIAWVRTFSYDKMKDDYGKLIIFQDTFFVIGRSFNYDISNSEYTQEYWIAKYDVNGQILWHKPFVMSNLAAISIPKFEAKFLCNKNIILVPCYFEGSYNLLLMRLNENGEISVFAKHKLQSSGFEAEVFTEIGDGFLVGGTKGSNGTDAWLLKLDLNGSVLWEKVYDNKKDEHLISLAVDGSGHIYLAVNSSVRETPEQSAVWLIKCDNGGNILNQTVFKGSYPSIAINDQNTCAVVYNSLFYPKEDICVAGFSEGFKSAWIINSISKGSSAGMFKIINTADDGFLIGGYKSARLFKDRPWFCKLDKTGNSIWDISIPNINSMVLEDMIFVKDSYFISGQNNLPIELPRAKDLKSEIDAQRSYDDTDIFIAKIVVDGNDLSAGRKNEIHD